MDRNTGAITQSSSLTWSMVLHSTVDLQMLQAGRVPEGLNPPSIPSKQSLHYSTGLSANCLDESPPTCPHVVSSLDGLT